MRASRDKGFTLVELLVVIIIIAILAAIAIPAFLNQRTKGYDATLKSDLKNVGVSVDTYLSGGGSASELRSITGATNVVEVRGRNRGTTANAQWNSFPELGRANVSDDSSLSVVAYEAASGRWLAHREGDYCITGVNGKSSYNYTSGGAVNYDQFLYLDRQAGGVRTMSELVKHRTNGGSVSCKGYVDTYMFAKGIPIPAG